MKESQPKTKHTRQAALCGQPAGMQTLGCKQNENKGYE